MKNEVKHTAHSSYRCEYHVVFAPKYRRKVVYNEIKKDVGEILRKLCNEMKVEIIEAQACPDHIHMLVSIPPYMSVAQFVGTLKSKSALMIFDRHVENTKKVVAFLASHPQVEKVNHPSLPGHPDHALYEKYFPNGGASIFTFDIKGGQKEAHAFIDALEIFSLLANVADVKSLVIHPATTTHSQLSDEELADQGIHRNTIRLSIGTEHIDDILADLEKGFAAAAAIE